MSSMKRTTTAAGALGYGRIFVGAADKMLPVMVNVANLTTREVDDRGYLKPGVILSRNGTLLGPDAAATPSAAVAKAGNVGNGTLTAITSDAGAPAEVIVFTLKTLAAHGGTFGVVGTVSGVLPDAVIPAGTAAQTFVYGAAAGIPINLTFTDGTTDWAVGDEYTITVTGGVQAKGFGVVPEATPISTGNTSTLLTAAGVKKVIVATIAQLNRDIIEDNLGAALTDDEVNGLVGTPLVLSN